MAYEDRLKFLKLPSLVFRRKRGDMIMMYKIMNVLVRIDPNELFTPAKTYHTRGHHQRVYKDPASKRVRINSFSQRAANDWNSLPLEVINAPSLNVFKNRLDEWWKDLQYVA